VTKEDQQSDVTQGGDANEQYQRSGAAGDAREHDGGQTKEHDSRDADALQYSAAQVDQQKQGSSATQRALDTDAADLDEAVVVSRLRALQLLWHLKGYARSERKRAQRRPRMHFSRLLRHLKSRST
ncbi:unnamed protein product, partial [Amoebophrya sp. A25]